MGDTPPRELPLHLVKKGGPPKVTKEEVEEVKEFDFEREEMVHYAMTITGIMDQELISEAIIKVFDKELPNEKMVHQNTQKLIDAAEAIEEQRSIALVENLREEVKVPKEEFRPDAFEYFDDFETAAEDKVIFESPIVDTDNNAKSHVRKVMSREGKMIIPPGPNKKCYCGSGDRYKKCCMLEDRERTDAIEKAEQEAQEKEKRAKDPMAPLYV